MSMYASLALQKCHLRNLFEQDTVTIRLIFQTDPCGGHRKVAQWRLQPEVRVLPGRPEKVRHEEGLGWAVPVGLWRTGWMPSQAEMLQERHCYLCEVNPAVNDSIDDQSDCYDSLLQTPGPLPNQTHTAWSFTLENALLADNEIIHLCSWHLQIPPKTRVCLFQNLVEVCRLLVRDVIALKAPLM